MNAQDLDRAVDSIKAEVRRRGIRWTTQRESIVRILLGNDEHLTVEAVHQRAKRDDTSISFSTVYRTVKLLVELGAIHKRHFVEGSAAYETALGRDHHDHLVCEGCGSITEFVDDRIEAIQDEIARRHGYRLTSHRLELFGFCPACAAKPTA